MTKPSISYKEAFFRDYLIPAGQLSELYVRTCSAHVAASISCVLFDNLGLVSAFAISPATADKAATFKSLGVSVSAIIDLLKEDLVILNCEKGKEDFTWRRKNNSLLERLRPLIAALHVVIGYSDKGRDAWMSKIMKDQTPLTRNNQYKKWRTFVKHIDFQQNMIKLGLDKAAKRIPKLGSEEGRNIAPALWRECFDTQWDGTQFETVKRPTLPLRATVASNDTGLLDVSMKFDPRKFLKKSLAQLKNIPKEISDQLQVLEFVRVCDYTELPAVVDEMQAWEQAQIDAMAKIASAIDSDIEKAKVDAVKQKLMNTFTPEELAILEKANAITSAKPAPRARAKAGSTTTAPCVKVKAGSSASGVGISKV